MYYFRTKAAPQFRSKAKASWNILFSISFHYKHLSDNCKFQIVVSLFCHQGLHDSDLQPTKSKWLIAQLSNTSPILLLIKCTNEKKKKKAKQNKSINKRILALKADVSASSCLKAKRECCEDLISIESTN